MTVLELINNTQPTFEGLGNTVFGVLKLYLVRVQNGEGYVVIPSVQGGQFKEKDDDGNMKFKGLRLGGPDLLLVQVLTRLNLQGEEYQQVKQYRSRQIVGKDKSEVHPYKQFGLPPIKNFFGTSLDDYLGQTTDKVFYSGKPAFVQIGEKPTGEKFEGSDITYWEIAEEYSSEKDMRRAEEVFWAKVRSGGQEEAAQVKTVSDVAALADKLTQIPEDVSGWTGATWKELGVQSVLKYRNEGKQPAEIAGLVGVPPPFVEDVLEVYKNEPF